MKTTLKLKCLAAAVLLSSGSAMAMHAAVSAVAPAVSSAISSSAISSSESSAVQACLRHFVNGIFARDNSSVYPEPSPGLDYDYMYLNKDGSVLFLFSAQFNQLNTGTTATLSGAWTCNNFELIVTTFSHNLGNEGEDAGTLTQAGTVRVTTKYRITDLYETLTRAEATAIQFTNDEDPFSPLGGTVVARLTTPGISFHRLHSYPGDLLRPLP